MQTKHKRNKSHKRKDKTSIKQQLEKGKIIFIAANTDKYRGINLSINPNIMSGEKTSVLYASCACKSQFQNFVNY